MPIAGDARSALDFRRRRRRHRDRQPALELQPVPRARAPIAARSRFSCSTTSRPTPSAESSAWSNSGFYDGLDFLRVVDSSDNDLRLAQAGSPDNTLTGGLAKTYDDEFNADAIFDYTGQLALASAGKDANGSQFFVTGQPQRGFDFNNTIFGQLVRGSKAFESILATADPNADTSVGAPLESTVIRSARIVADPLDAVLQVRAGTKTGTRTVSVTAVDEDGREVTQSLRVRVVADTVDDPPILLAPASPILAASGDRVTIHVDATDLEGTDYQIRANANVDGTNGIDVSASSVDQLGHTLTFKIKDGFTGAASVAIGVRGYNAVARGSIYTEPGEDVTSLRVYDTQTITISVGGAAIERTSDAGTIAVHTGEAIDDRTVLATFDSDDDAQSTAFTANVDWGDGTITSGVDVERTGKGHFAVLATGDHVYARAADALPVVIEIDGTNGTSATVYGVASIHPAVALSSTGTLGVYGTAADDAVDLSSDEDGRIVVRFDGSTSSFDANDVKRIAVALYGGDDVLQTVDAGALPAMTIDGGAGNDTLYGGSGDDQISGGDGDDSINGGDGDDLVHGDAGNDTLYGNAGKNILFGDDDDDRIIGGGGRDSIEGGDGDDRLYGRDGDDTITGGGGADRVYGEGGNDVLIGGSSNDRLYGGDGDDTLYGNAGHDTLNGGPGTNVRGDKDDDDTLIDLVG